VSPANGDAPTARTCAVIVMYNSGPEAATCARHVLAQVGATADVLIVDNGSVDDSAAVIGAELADEPRVSLVALSPNRGFSGGANFGLERALAGGHEYIWLLADDIVCPPDALAPLVAAMDADGSIGLAGPYLVEENSPGVVYFGGGDVSASGASHRHEGEKLADIPRGGVEDSDFVTGASMFMRAEALSQVGLMDETFWLYWEDVDLSWRFKVAGWRVVVTADSTGLHDVTHPSDSSMRIRHRYAHRNHLRFVKKHRIANPYDRAARKLVNALTVWRTKGWQDARPIVLGTLDFLTGRSGRMPENW